MVWEVSTEPDEKGQFNPSGGGDFNRVNVAGLYHVHVTAVDEAGGKSGDNLVVDYEILGGKPAGQEGRSFRDYFSPSEAARNRVVSWALACGITTEEEGRKAKEAKKPLAIHPGDARGRHLVLEVENGEDQKGNPKLECNWGIYSIEDPKAEGVLNKGVLAAAGDASDDPFGGGSKAEQGTGSPDESDTGKGPDSDEFTDFF